MTNLYLILHKVRGEPAFDIAIPTTIADEAAWIIPTSGHRAYPVDYWALDELCIMTMDKYSERYHSINEVAASIPSDWPDHYACETSVHYNLSQTASSLLAKLGLGSKPIKRRRID